MNLHNYFLVFFCVLLFSSCQQKYKTQGYTGQNISIDKQLPVDSSMDSVIYPFKHKIDEQMDRIIGHSTIELLVYKPESPLSNFVSDVIYSKAQRYLNDNKADSLSLIALMNIKGIRAPIAKGEISVRNIFELMPFENELVILKLSGDSIVSLFKTIALSEGDGIAGAKVVYSNSNIKGIWLNNKPLDLSKNYYLATSDYLANGGDNYSMILNPLRRDNVGIRLREAIIDYIEELTAKGRKVEAEIENRIVFN